MSGNILGCYSLGVAIGTWWVESRDAIKNPATHRTAPQQIIWYKTSIVVKLKNPHLDLLGVLSLLLLKNKNGIKDIYYFVIFSLT